MSSVLDTRYEAVIIGDSFVFGYAHYLRNNNVFTPEEVSKHLRVDDIFCRVHLIGQHGASIKDFCPTVLAEIDPDVVVVDMATND